jgi:UDP-hydrolysing UDP-N-acetyl-D-glucosamine 2-epimerase
VKKICVVIGSRANYSSIKSAMRAIQAHPDLELQVVATASSILDRFGTVSDLIELDGFRINEKLFTLIEGETPVTMAKSTGIALLELPSVFDRLRPDIVVTVGDRFETMATTLAAAYMNIAIAHTMGGEVSGTIDESIRHAITKFAHIHLPASQDAAERIIRLGENPDTVHMVGCPRIDLVSEILADTSTGPILPNEGVGSSVDLEKPFLLVSQHPVTTEYGSGESQIVETLLAVKDTGMQAVVLWPNADAGSDDIARGIRKLREQGVTSNMHFYKNLPIETYVKLMAKAKCLVGNSSSGIREGAFIGTPVVNIGSRQNMRERGSNVLDATPDRASILAAINRQLEHGPFESEKIYGSGVAGKDVAEILARYEAKNIQKTIGY